MKIKKIKYPVYDVVRDGMMSLPAIGEGRFIPALIIDTYEDNSLKEFIEFHQTTPPGDAETTWTRPITIFSPKNIILQIKFIQPFEIEFGINFNLSNQYFLVDGIIQSRCFYLETGKKENKVSDLRHKILIEVPNSGFDKKWDALLLKTLVSNIRKMDVTLKEANHLAKEQIESTREVWNIRR